MLQKIVDVISSNITEQEINKENIYTIINLLQEVQASFNSYELDELENALELKVLM